MVPAAVMYFSLSCIVFTSATCVNAAVASSFAGSTVTALFPSPNATITVNATFFPDASEVGFGGPTPSSCLRISIFRAQLNSFFTAGDEAGAIATAPAVALMDTVFPLVQPATSDKKAGFNVLEHLGSLSPFQSVKSLGLPDTSALVPDGCKITQVHLLHRHGARYPTSGGNTFAAAIHAAASTTGFNASGPLGFLNTWTYKLGAEILTPFGRSEM